ncbi:MAG: imidazolonepropionase [Bacteroidetes bacterium]|nr:imidazolonepropionase [Bacteroidota bacterium]
MNNPSQIITVDTFGKNYKRGKEQNELNILTGHSLIIEDDIIKDLVPNSIVKNLECDEIVDIKNKIVLPGFVECHTHTAFSGSRSDEFRDRLKGISYEEIANRGGGINKTVNAVRNSSVKELVDKISPRIDYFMSQGITSLEIKSGYGLDFENEIKLLKVINYLNEKYPIDIIPTFLGAHTYPEEFKENHKTYLNLLIDELLPFISQNHLAKFCDGFCESTAFSVDEIEEFFTKAKSLGLDLKIHSDQFNRLGGIDLALKYNAVSVDHLEVINDADINKLGSSEIACVLLPGVSFFLNHQYAPARKLIDNNSIVALSTDYNPGSSNICNLNLIMSLAAIKMGMTIEETISAVTINAAKAIGLNEERGSIEIGKKADLAIFETNDYSDIVYNVGRNLNYMTIKNGEIIYIAE